MSQNIQKLINRYEWIWLVNKPPTSVDRQKCDELRQSFVFDVLYVKLMNDDAAATAAVVVAAEFRKKRSS